MRYVLTLILLCITQIGYGQVVVSDQVPMPIKYPAEVYKMTDAEFFQWATDFNKKQVADLETRRKQITEPRYYYGTQVRQEGLFNNYKANDSRSYSRQTTIYSKQWSNSNYVGPGPLTIVNPYCRPTKVEK
ncbi:MAG: hypothetical protein WC315_00095 [Candidatus Omnitrophota bacterium]|jgi:hypothetical protein